MAKTFPVEVSISEVELNGDMVLHHHFARHH